GREKEGKGRREEERKEVRGRSRKGFEESAEGPLAGLLAFSHSMFMTGLVQQGDVSGFNYALHGNAVCAFSARSRFCSGELTNHWKSRDRHSKTDRKLNLPI
ncbi:MAG: hypothetical protein ACR2O4_13380, partial [Hyphomicrobiaceae bacterium]